MSPERQKPAKVEVRRTEPQDWPAMVDLLERVKEHPAYRRADITLLTAKEMEARYHGALNHVAIQSGRLVGFCVHQTVYRRVKEVEQKELEAVYLITDPANALEITKALVHRFCQDALGVGVTKSSLFVTEDCLNRLEPITTEGSIPLSVEPEQRGKRVRIHIPDVLEATR